MNEWIDALSDLTAAGEAVVLVVVTGVRGSAPREPGARMLVTAAETMGTIGGGQLEYECTRIAVSMLRDGDAGEWRTFPLGTSMGQCCGGVVDVLFELVDSGPARWLRDLCALHGQRKAAVLVTAIDAPANKAIVTADDTFGGLSLPPDRVARARGQIDEGGSVLVADGYLYEPIVGSDFNIAVFGAGHVGSAVVAALSGLDSNIRWVDNRRGMFRSVPANVRAIEADDPALEVAALPPAAYFLIMTHSHALDFDIASRILLRRDAAYCGLIGSRSKRRRFEKRLIDVGIGESELPRLRCPIGVDGITGKKPAEIAVAVAAELLATREALAGTQRYPASVAAVEQD